MENYKVIKDYPDYAISRDGEVLNLKFNKKLKTFISPKGYVVCNIYIGNKRTKHYRIHRLIAEAFINNFNNYPQVNHINGIKSDNRIENLEWCNSSQNLKHAFINKLKSHVGEKNTKSKLKEYQVLEIRNSVLSYKELSILYNISLSTICSIIKRRLWKHI